jgi:MFS family permease
MMTIFGAGNMVGGPLSGWLADHHGWQFAFWIQVSNIPPNSIHRGQL